MAFEVSYQTSVGAIAVARDTTGEAIDQAMGWIREGRENVTMRDLDSGQKYDADQIRSIKERIDRQERFS